MTSNTAIDSSSEFNSLLDDWNRNQSGSENVSSITRLADILEKETEAYYKMDPDPMDDRHPGRANPTCILGQLMKAMFRHEEFMNKVVGEYIMSSRESEQSPLHTASCRLLLDVLPGLETSVVFQETEGLVARLVYWAETAEEPLRSYATGLLGGAMEIQDVATNFKEHNSRLVPLMLQRLHELRVIQEEEEKNQKKAALTDSDVRHFASFASGMDSSREKATSIDNVEDISENVTLAKDEKSVKLMSTAASSSESTPASGGESLSTTVIPMSPATSCGSLRTSTVSPFQPYHEDGSYRASLKRALSPAYASADSVTKRHRKRKESFGGAFDTDCSNSSWAEMEPLVIGSYSLSPPLTTTMKQRLILQYLTPMGDYQELLSSIFEHRAMDLIFYYISLRENSDVRLAFEALKYLATLLCHKKFAIEFLVRGGLQRLLQVHRPSIAATGVALCVYYLSYFEDVMERVCLLPEHVLSDLVGYVLWLMECSHDSSRCHACMFFSQVFPFRVMLDLFDQRDGLRRLFNVISTLGILNIEESSDDSLNEDVIFAMRQAARHVCGALKKYFEAQLTIKADDVRRSHMRNDGSSPLQETPGYKPLKLTGPVIAENIELLMELLPVRSLWQPELTFHNLGGLQLLVRLVAMAPEWTNYPGKPETIKSALDVLTVLTVSPRSQVALLSNISLPDNLTTPALSVLTGLAEGEILSDAEVQKSALNVLINCVCGPVERLGGGVGRFMGTGSKKKVNMRIGEDVLSRMWNGMRTNNGIMVLLKLLSIKTPITEADTIRALVCKALLGMSRSETVKQILSKLPLFNNGQLQSLMKEPILQDRRQEHVKFCKYASQLLERVSGKQPNTLDASLEDIRKADIVAQTKIIYREKELLQLIHDHLASKGLTETASVLQREAGLPRCTTPPLHHPTSPHIFSPATPKPTRQLSQTTPLHSTSTPIVSASCHSVLVTPSTEHPPVITPTPGPIRFSLHRQSQTSSPSQQKPLVSKSRFQREGGTAYPLRSKSSKQGVGGEYTACLDKIVTEYLRKQHALCRNPVSTCPPMSLFNPHRCPEPQGRRSAPASITSRLMHRAFNPRYGGLDGAKLNRKYIYNRFLPFQTYRDKDDDGFATCCFSADEKYLMLGTFNGDLKLINMTTGEEAGTLTCHTSPIIRMEPSRDGHLLLTSSWGLNQDSALWMMGESLECKYTFDEHFMEFSRLVQDRLVGTKDETAHIYDVATGVQLMTLYDQDKANNYRTNVATFSPTDELVLNDGVLWDLRSRKPLHKFDKFNQYISGVFHPMGQEIIINSEVWDQRTFKLLHTVPALDQCQIKFNHSGDVIFATHMDEEADIGDDYRRKQFSSTLRTFDATDYSSIGTMDLKTRSIFDLCMDKFDSCLAVVEVSKQNSPYADGSTDESICRLYEIGKLRDEEDDVQEEDEEGDGVEEEEDEEDDEEDPSFLDFASLQDSDVNEDQHFILDVDFDKYCTVKQHQSKMTHVPRIISMDQPEDVFWSDPVWWRINILPISQQNITDITFFHLLKSNKGINLCNKLDWSAADGMETDVEVEASADDEDGNDDVAADEERDEEDAVEYSPSSSDDDQDDNDNDDLDDDMLFALV